MWKIDEDASFSRCVLLDGRELEGDWWIVRPLGVLGSSGLLLVQDRITGNLAPLSSVMLLVAADASSERPTRTPPAREAAPQPSAWQPERLAVEAPRLEPALIAAGAGKARPGAAESEWNSILRDDVPQELPSSAEVEIGPNHALRLPEFP